MTPSAGVSRPARSGAIPAWVACTPISAKVSLSKSRSMRSRAVSLPAACCRATASSPPMCRAFARRRARSSAWSFIAMRSAHLAGAVQDPGVDAGVRGRGAEELDHGGDLAAVMRRVVGHVLQQHTERDVEGLAPRGLVMDLAGHVRLAQVLDEGLLLGLERVPPAAHFGHRGNLEEERLRRRGALEALEPVQVGAVDMGEHARQVRHAEVLAEVLRAGVLAECGGDVEELAVGPAMVFVE